MSCREGREHISTVKASTAHKAQTRQSVSIADEAAAHPFILNLLELKLLLICRVYEPWAAAVGGIIGGLAYYPSSLFVSHILKIDDVVDAFTVSLCPACLLTHCSACSSTRPNCRSPFSVVV